MVWKTLKNGQIVGTNTALVTANSENVVIYTVPAGKTAIMREMILTPFGGNASVNFNIYILPNGATDLATNVNQSVIPNFTKAQLGGATVGFMGDSATLINSNTPIFNIAPAKFILSAGDQIKLRIFNSTGGNINDTTYGVNVQISGDES